MAKNKEKELKKRIIRFLNKKSFEAGNLPEKYDAYSGGDDYALLVDLEDVIKVIKMCGIVITEKDQELLN